METVFCDPAIHWWSSAIAIAIEEIENVLSLRPSAIEKDHLRSYRNISQRSANENKPTKQRSPKVTIWQRQVTLRKNLWKSVRNMNVSVMELQRILRQAPLVILASLVAKTRWELIDCAAPALYTDCPHPGLDFRRISADLKVRWAQWCCGTLQLCSYMETQASDRVQSSSWVPPVILRSFAIMNEYMGTRLKD